MSDDNDTPTPTPTPPPTQSLNYGAAAADFFALARQLAAPPWTDEAHRYRALKHTLRTAASLAEADARLREAGIAAEAEALSGARAARRKANNAKKMDALVNALPAVLAAVQALADDGEVPQGDRPA